MEKFEKIKSLGRGAQVRGRTKTGLTRPANRVERGGAQRVIASRNSGGFLGDRTTRYGQPRRISDRLTLRCDCPPFLTHRARSFS